MLWGLLTATLGRTSLVYFRLPSSDTAVVRIIADVFLWMISDDPDGEFPICLGLRRFEEVRLPDAHPMQLVDDHISGRSSVLKL